MIVTFVIEFNDSIVILETNNNSFATLSYSVIFLSQSLIIQISNNLGNIVFLNAAECT